MKGENVSTTSLSIEKIPKKISRYFMNTQNLGSFSCMKLDDYIERKNHKFSDFDSFRKYQGNLKILYSIITEKFMEGLTNGQKILNEIYREKYELFVEIDEEKYNNSLDVMEKIFSFLKKIISNFHSKHFLAGTEIYDLSNIYFPLSEFPHSTFHIWYKDDNYSMSLVFFSCKLMCLEIHDDQDGVAKRIIEKLKELGIVNSDICKEIRYDIVLDEEGSTISIGRNTRFGRGTELPELLKVSYKPDEDFEYSFGGIFLRNMLDYDFLAIRSEEIVEGAIFLMNSLLNSPEADYEDAIFKYTKWTIARNTFRDYSKHFIKRIVESRNKHNEICGTTENIEGLFEKDYYHFFNKPTDHFFKEYFSRIYPAKMNILSHSLSKVNAILGIIILFSSTIPGIPNYLRPFLFFLGVIIVLPYFLRNSAIYYLEILKRVVSRLI